jgi:hypothetical protein
MRLWLSGKQSGRLGSERPDQWSHWIPEPPRLSTFKRRGGGGGGPESRAHLSDGYDQSAQINGAHWIPEPPHLSTFKRRGGGPESGAHLSDGYDQSAQINGAQAFWTSLTFLPLISMGPSPVVSPLEPPLPCNISSTSPHNMAPPQSIVLLPVAMCLPLSPLPIHSPSWYTLFPFSHFRLTPPARCSPPHLPTHLSSSFSHVSSAHPPLPLCAPAFTLASTSIHQAIQLIQVAVRGDLHVPKVSSWLDHSQSQGSSY